MGDSMRVSAILFLGLINIATILDTGSCYDNTSSILCIGSERQALLRFKQHLQDPSNRLSSWSSSKLDYCNWTGIICDKLTGHVKELRLGNPYANWENQMEPDTYERSKFQGNISSSLLDLKHLSYLDLSYNDFGGIPIPSFIGSLVSLTYLNLSNSGFEGLIPHQLGNLSRLSHLDVQGPEVYFDNTKLYVENLNWLSNIPSLLHLDLSWVNLSASSDWLLMINQLPSLLELRLTGCGLVLMPPLSKVNFTSLKVLEISDNNFGSSMPTWILSLGHLVSLNLHYNHFEGPIPSGFSNLTSLRSLDLSSNDLLSPLPNWFFNLGGILSLDLSRNNFESIPSGLKNMTALRYLDLYEIDFSSNTIPEWLYGFQYLEVLDLHSTNLQGEISSAIQHMTSLTRLDLSGNDLEGALPRTMGNLCNLQSIILLFNKLGGEISDAFESISGCLSDNLKSLVLAENNFSGLLTDRITEFGNLQYLDLSGNLISGPIPESVGRLRSLQTLWLGSNQLTGTLPESIGNLSNLQDLDISNNNLEGFVTEDHFTDLTNLNTLTASHNRLVLKVSPTWVPPFHLRSLELSDWNLGPQFPLWLQFQDFFWKLDLSCTNISDRIPTWFWNITSRTSYLNISHNQIQGELPVYLDIEYQFVMIYLGSNQFMGPLPRISANVTELDLSNNLLSGGVSDFLCDPNAVPNRLKILHLGENQLSGEIPDCWMNWQSLKVIKLENNNLTGKLPNSMGYLHGLQSLHLRNNSLYGVIPPSLGKCKELLTLDLGLNNFVGKIPVWLGVSLSKLMVLGLRSNKLNGEIPSEFCHLTSLQIVDLADNNLSGSIPRCLNNLTSMIELQHGSPDSDYRLFYSFYYGSFFEEASVVIKGREFQYDTILTLLTSLDISSNKLSGEIPEEITALLGLRGLNLSGNHLTGEIPRSIGAMRTLESLDLSRNQISGNIPPSMSNLNSLNHLNLSHNNLSGPIPLSTQLQSLDASGFIGNKLCGPPLKENCSTKGEKTWPDSKNGGGEEVEGFYVSMVVGFVVGFGGIFVEKTDRIERDHS